MQLLDGSERKSQCTRLRENMKTPIRLSCSLLGASNGVRCTVIRFCHFVSSECFIRLITVSNFLCCNANCVARKLRLLCVAGRGVCTMAMFAAAFDTSM
jgi:hypothetical protein